MSWLILASTAARVIAWGLGAVLGWRERRILLCVSMALAAVTAGITGWSDAHGVTPYWLRDVALVLKTPVAFAMVAAAFYGTRLYPPQRRWRL